MGTDTTERTTPCPCGTGELLVQISTPDHRWLSAYNVHHRYEIKCQSCSKEYMLDGSRVVRRSGKALQVAARNRYNAAYEEFNTSPPVIEVKRAFGAHIDAMRSVVAIHRYLKEHGIETYAIGTFRKKWTGGLQWADRHVYGQDMPKILTLLGREATRFDTELHKLEELHAAIPTVPTVMACLS